MFRKFFPVALLTFCVLWHAGEARSQCGDKITLVPLAAQKPANKGRDFVRFKYALTDTDSLFVESHEDTGTTIGPYDTGFAIARNGKVVQRTSIKDVAEFRHEDRDYLNSFSVLAVTRACGRGGPIFFVTMQYMGNITSPALLFVVVPSPQGFDVSTLPSISGGTLEVSKADPFHFRTWDNLHEGQCEACKTAYEVSEYEIQAGKLTRTHRYRTRRLYTSGDFDSRRRIRFIP